MMKGQSEKKHTESFNHVITQEAQLYVPFLKYSSKNWKQGIPKCDFHAVHLCVCYGTVS